MKKIVFAMIFFCGFILQVYSETVLSETGSELAPGKMQASYREEYFEHSEFSPIGETIVNTDTYYGALTYVPTDVTNRGMLQDFILRVGVSNTASVGVDLLYVLQKLDVLDYNTFQLISIFGERKFMDMVTVRAGVRIPLKSNVKDGDLRLINNSDRQTLYLSAHAENKLWFINYSAAGEYEEEFLTDTFYQRQGSFSGGLGFDIYDNPEKQKVSMMFEVGSDVTGFRTRYDSEFYFVPQVRMVFYNDFDILIGASFLTYAEGEIYTGKTFSGDFSVGPEYIIKLNYILNSDVRKQEATAGTGTGMGLDSDKNGILIINTQPYTNPSSVSGTAGALSGTAGALSGQAQGVTGTAGVLGVPARITGTAGDK
jgi:hypothetical protein